MKTIMSLVSLLLIVVIISTISSSLKDTEIVYEVGSVFSDVTETIVNAFKEVFADVPSKKEVVIDNLSSGIKDINKNPSNWQMTNRIEIPATSKNAKGGISIEEEWTHISTGFKMYKHDVKTVKGKSIKRHPHWRLTPTQIGECE